MFHIPAIVSRSLVVNDDIFGSELGLESSNCGVEGKTGGSLGQDRIFLLRLLSSGVSPACPDQRFGASCFL